MDQNVHNIQYDSFQKVLKCGQPSNLILKNEFELSDCNLITEMSYHVSVFVTWAEC